MAATATPTPPAGVDLAWCTSAGSTGLPHHAGDRRGRRLILLTPSRPVTRSCIPTSPGTLVQPDIGEAVPDEFARSLSRVPVAPVPA